MVSSLPDRITLDHAAETLTALGEFLEPVLDQWEACDGTAPPSIARHLPAGGDLRRIALSEMIKIDLAEVQRAHANATPEGTQSISSRLNLQRKSSPLRQIRTQLLRRG